MKGKNSVASVLLCHILISSGLVSILVWFMDLQVRPSRTHPNSWKERILTLLSFPLLPILTLLVVALPTMQAQTKLLVGIPLQFRVTRK